MITIYPHAQDTKLKKKKNWNIKFNNPRLSLLFHVLKLKSLIVFFNFVHQTRISFYLFIYI